MNIQTNETLNTPYIRNGETLATILITLEMKSRVLELLLQNLKQKGILDDSDIKQLYDDAKSQFESSITQ